MNDQIYVRVSVSTNKVGSEDYEVTAFEREEWEAMDDTQREEACREIMFELIGWSYWEVDGDD